MNRFPIITLILASTLSFAAKLPAATIVVDYPQAHVLYQRDAADVGILRIRGTVSDVAEPAPLEARFNGGPWQELGASTADGKFAGSISGSTGQGQLEVRVAEKPDSITSVAPVAVGDLFLITGQSNADGRGSVNVTLAETNPFVGAKFREGRWSKGDDPSDSGGEHASPWPIVLNALIPEQKVPMGFVQGAAGSTVVRQWRKGESYFERAMTILREATDGAMGVKAVLYYQGENDITHYNQFSVLGDYALYKEHLTAMLFDFHEALSVPVLVGQITNLLDERDRNDGVRRAQQESWSESPYALPGATTYDIFPTDGVHYREADNMKVFAGRWTYAIRNAFYTNPPRPLAQLLSVKRVSDTEIQLTYDCELTISDWRGKTASRPTGFRVVSADGSLGDGSIGAARVAGKAVVLKFASPVPDGARFYYGSGNDGQDKAVLRVGETGQPVPMVFDVSIE